MVCVPGSSLVYVLFAPLRRRCGGGGVQQYSKYNARYVPIQWSRPNCRVPESVNRLIVAALLLRQCLLIRYLRSCGARSFSLFLCSECAAACPAHVRLCAIDLESAKPIREPLYLADCSTCLCACTCVSAWM